jgi:hypothetical protein
METIMHKASRNTLPIVAALLAMGFALPAYAFKTGDTFRISRTAMEQFCGKNGGVVTGGGHSGCDGLCGDGQICDADCVGDDCEIRVLIAKLPPRATIGSPIGALPPASLSTAGAGGGGGLPQKGKPLGGVP